MRQLTLLFILLCTCLSGWAQPTIVPPDSIVISEINYNAAGPGSENLEFFEIYNRTRTPRNLDGFIVAYSAYNETLPSLYWRDTLRGTNTNLPPLGRMVFARDSAAVALAYNYAGSYQLDTLTATGFYPRLNDYGGMIWLLDPNGQIIDTVRYYSTAGSGCGDWPDVSEGAGGLGASISLCDENRDGSCGFNWVASPNNLGGYFNGVIRLRANPGLDCAGAVEALSVTVPDPLTIKIAFNQLLKFPSEWVLADTACFTNPLTGYPAIRGISAANIAGITAVPNPISDTVVITLVNPLPSGVFYGMIVTPSSANGGIILGRTSNLGTPVMLVPDTFIFGYNIIAPQSNPVMITEINYQTPGGVDSLEYVEVFNPNTTSNVFLGALRFTRGLTFSFPDSILTPRTYAIVAANARAVRNFYRIPNSVMVFEYPSIFGTNNLDNNGEVLEIRNTQNQVIDTVAYGVARPWASYAKGKGSALLLSDTADYLTPWLSTNPANPLTGYNDDACNWTADTIGNYKGALADGTRIFGTPGAGYTSIKPRVGIGLPYQTGIDSLVLRVTLNPVRPVQEYTWTSFWPVRPTYNGRKGDTLRVDTSGHYYVTIYDSLYGCQQSNVVRVRIRDVDNLVFHTDLPVTSEVNTRVTGFTVLCQNSALVPEETFDDSVKIRIASGPAGGMIIGDTVVFARNGMAMFTNISFSKPGTYRLVAGCNTRGRVPLMAFDPTYKDTVMSPLSANIDVKDQITRKLVFQNLPLIAKKDSIAPPFVINALNTNNQLERTFYGKVVLYIVSGPAGGRITSGDTLKDAYGGYITFDSLRFNKPGIYTIGASCGWLYAENTSIVITDPDTRFLEFRTKNVSGIVNRDVNFTIWAKDGAGALDTTFNGPIDISQYFDYTGPRSAVVGPASVNARAGVANFTWKFTDAGVYVIVAKGTGPSANLVPTRTDTIMINHPTVKYLRFDPNFPSPVRMNSHLPKFTISALYEDSTLATSFNDPVTLSIVAGPNPNGRLVGETTRPSFSGVCYFGTAANQNSGVQLNEPGVYTLKAESGRLMAIKDIFIFAVGLDDDLKASQFVVYPNPSNGIYNIQSVNGVEYGVEVLDATGKLILSGNNLSNIDITTQAAGVYTLKVQVGEAVKSIRIQKL